MSRQRAIVTPEGIPLRFALAGVGERIAAFAFDLFVQAVAVAAIVIVLGLVGSSWSGDWLIAIIMVVAFLVMNFYFVVFEVRGQGATPGKRRAGIRVIDARGGQLETSSVIARNLVRELEVWTPLRFMLARKLVWPDAPAWATALAIVWAFVFMFLPLFNRDRMRVGDLIAGTLVVQQPKVVLVPDLVADGRGAYELTAEQLSIYGVFELQVLERVLRANPPSDDDIAAIAAKIRAKIGYTAPVTDDAEFLREFYTAQRAHLEQQLLFGHRRQDKHSA
jgi:uncharacterized RDD family membrane protein YckC